MATVIEVDKDAGHIVIIKDGVRSGQTIRWKDCVISAPSNGNLKIDLVYVNESNQLVLVLEDNSEIIVTGVTDHGELTGVTASQHHTKYTDAEALAAAKAGAGTDEGDLVQLDAVGLPAVDGSQLTGLPAGYTDEDAVDAMGAKADDNPLHHDKAEEWGAAEHTAIGNDAPHHAKYLDSEAKAAAVQAGAITDGVTKAPTHDAVFDVKATADGAIAHSLATAVSDFLVASGVGVFIKKTLAEVKTILGLGTAAYTAATDYVTHALATAANDFLVASASGAYVKKTLAETLTILGKAAASGLASLNASSKVEQQPASITDHLDGSPDEDDATKAPTSEWAFDHKAGVSAHHSKTSKASEITSERFPVDRLPAMTDEKIWKGTGGNVEEVDMPEGIPADFANLSDAQKVFIMVYGI